MSDELQQKEQKKDPRIAHLKDEIAELGCMAFIGQGYARQVMDVVAPEDFFFGSGAFRRIATCVREILDAGDEVTLLALKHSLETRVDREGDKNWLSQVGGEAGLRKSLEAFAVDREKGQITFKTVSPSLLADAKVAARIVKLKADARRLVENVGPVIAKLQDPESGLSVRAAADLIAQEAARVSTGKAPPERRVSEDEEMMERRLTQAATGEKVGIYTGFSGFDRRTGGLRNDILSIAAFKKQGKSAMGLEIVNYAARQEGARCGIVTTENPAELLHLRRIAMNSGGRLTMEQLRGVDPMTGDEAALAVEILHEQSRDPIWIVEDVYDPEEALRVMDRMTREHELQVLLVDYLTRFRFGERDREGKMSYFCQRLCDLPRTYRAQNLNVIAIVQLNEAGRSAAKLLGHPSSDFSYMTKQINKDATAVSVLDVEDERFECGCRGEDARSKGHEYLGTHRMSYDRPKWTVMPVSGRCADCRQRVRVANPVRRGRWIIEVARNMKGGRMIPIMFDGDFMRIREMSDEPPNYPEEPSGFYIEENV